MLTDKQRKGHIDQIRSLPARLEEIVRPLGDDQLDTPYGEGKWTVRQVVHHMAESHMNGFSRFKWMLTEDHPTIKPYDQDAWANQPDIATLPIDSSLKLLHGLHERWALLLERLNDDQWKRTAYHPEEGELTVDDMLVAYAGHGIKHIGHIQGLLQSKNW